jgi:hypothetical protein
MGWEEEFQAPIEAFDVVSLSLSTPKGMQRSIGISQNIKVKRKIEFQKSACLVRSSSAEHEKLELTIRTKYRTARIVHGIIKTWTIRGRHAPGLFRWKRSWRLS